MKLWSADRARTLNPTILLLSIVSFIVVAVMTVTGPMLPLIADDFGTSIGGAGIIVSAFAVPYGACQIFFGPVGDRLGKLHVIALALGVSAIFVCASGVADSIEFLASMRFLCGVFMAATVPLALAYIADEIPYKDRQPVMGRFVNGLVLGQITGGVLGGIASEYFDWRLIFYLFGASGFVLALLLGRTAQRTDSKKRGPIQSPRDTVRLYLRLCARPSSRDLIIVGAIEGALVFGLLAYLGAFLRDTYQLNYALIGLVLAAFGVGGMVYAAAVYRLVPMLGERGMISVGAVLVSATYLGILAVPHWLGCMPLLFVSGFGFYLIHNTLQTRATEMSEEARGTAVSFWVLMVFLGQGIGVVMFGRVIDAEGYGTAFTSGALGIILIGLWYQRRLRCYDRVAQVRR